MAMKATWVLVADGARAHFYRAEDGRLVPALDHDLAVPVRAAARAAETDRPGRAFDSAGVGRHAMEPRTTWKVHEKCLLAQAVAAELTRAVDGDDLDRLVLVAPPKVLGDLRAALDPRIARRVVAQLPKDLTHLSGSDLALRLQAALRG